MKNSRFFFRKQMEGAEKKKGPKTPLEKPPTKGGGGPDQGALFLEMLPLIFFTIDKKKKTYFFPFKFLFYFWAAPKPPHKFSGLKIKKSMGSFIGFQEGKFFFFWLSFFFQIKSHQGPVHVFIKRPPYYFSPRFPKKGAGQRFFFFFSGNF